jgi:Cellulase (glycosyl hydrolase family 5)
MRMRTRHSLLLVALTAALGLVAAAPAGASRDQFTVLDPTPSLLNGESAARRADILDRLQALGVDTVRIQVQWRFLAPSPASSTQPAGFDPTDPADYPARAFDVLDSVVRGAKERGMDVLLTPTSPVPDWATPNKRGGLYSPNPTDFEQFVQALGERYSGTCVPPGCSPSANGDPLPRVDQWAVWNEPNLRTFLRPQRTAAGKTISGFLYRGLFLAAQRGLELSGHKQDTLLLGDTSPSRGSASTAPLKFMRQVFCLGPDYKPQRSCSPIEASGWAHHPYNPHIPPWEKPKRIHRSIISIGSMGHMVTALRRVAEAGGTTERLPVYVTEYGIESYPQGGFGVSPQRQAEYLGIAEYLLWRNPWVKAFAQYLLDDDRNPRELLSFQTGLRFASGFPKPAYDAFPITLVARRTRLGGVELWGHVRPGDGPYRIEVRYRDGDVGAGQLLTFGQTDGDGYFRIETGWRSGRQWQVSTELSNGAILQGPFIRSYRFD